MHLEFDIPDIFDAAQIAGYVWAMKQPPYSELNEMASFNAHYDAFVKGTELEEDPPDEANRAMLWEAWERGVEQAKNLFRADSFISVGEAAERARCDVSYIKAEIKRYQDSNGQKGLYAQKVGKGRTSGYAIHPDDFRKWMMNPRRGSRSE
jgi:hypothetical protein